MLKSKLSIRRTGVEETPPPDPGFTTPITPATPSHYREGLEVATFASHREEDTVSVAPAFSFPNLAIPSTPQANFSRVPFGVQVQLQLQQLKIGNDGAAAAAAGTPNLREGVVSFKPRESYINYPSTSLEETKRPFKSIDSSSEDDLTLTPILPLDGWVIDLPPERYFRHASGSPYLQPRMAKLFDDDIGKASVWMW
jgi:hypothetical protein